MENLVGAFCLHELLKAHQSFPTFPSYKDKAIFEYFTIHEYMGQYEF